MFTLNSSTNRTAKKRPARLKTTHSWSWKLMFWTLRCSPDGTYPMWQSLRRNWNMLKPPVQMCFSSLCDWSFQGSFLHSPAWFTMSAIWSFTSTESSGHGVEMVDIVAWKQFLDDEDEDDILLVLTLMMVMVSVLRYSCCFGFSDGWGSCAACSMEALPWPRMLWHANTKADGSRFCFNRDTQKNSQYKGGQA